MGLANWVVGKMVDAFLAQPPEEKAKVFDTMATKFWDAATPEEIARISELLLPRFLEHFLSSASTEQKAEMMKSLVDEAQLREMAQSRMPELIGEYLNGMSAEQWQKIVPMPGASGMPGMPRPKKRPPPSPGGMMPW